jgi:hypothetical protein
MPPRVAKLHRASRKDMEAESGTQNRDAEYGIESLTDVMTMICGRATQCAQEQRGAE